MQAVPDEQRFAKFEFGFGQRVLLTVDTEEEFDWGGDFSRTEHGFRHVPSIARFQEFCENLGVTPVYLVDWPIAQSEIAREIIGHACARGAAEVGIQLHPWVNPPFEEEIGPRNSFAGNLPPMLEREKLLRLRDAITENFSRAPLIYRAGRYGTGPATAGLLREAGIPIDTSVRSKFDYRTQYGPDYSRHPLRPYWLDDERRVLELPVTTVYWGMLRQLGAWLHPLLGRLGRVRGAAARLGLLERIALTPEGVTAQEALRGVDIAVDDGVPIIVLSFHSPSLAAGFTPYVRTDDDLDELYDWFRTIYAYLERLGVRPTTVEQIMAHVRL